MRGRKLEHHLVKMLKMAGLRVRAHRSMLANSQLVRAADMHNLVLLIICSEADLAGILLQANTLLLTGS